MRQTSRFDDRGLEPPPRPVCATAPDPAQLRWAETTESAPADPAGLRDLAARHSRPDQAHDQAQEQSSGELPPRNRTDWSDVCYVPADNGLLPHLTTQENIWYGLRHKVRRLAVPVGTARDRVDDQVRKLRLMATLRLRPHQLSHEQRQRVAIARALVCLPHTVVFDRPGPLAGEELRRLLADALPAGQPSLTVIVCGRRTPVTRS